MLVFDEALEGRAAQHAHQNERHHGAEDVADERKSTAPQAAEDDACGSVEDCPWNRCYDDFHGDKGNVSQGRKDAEPFEELVQQLKLGRRHQVAAQHETDDAALGVGDRDPGNEADQYRPRQRPGEAGSAQLPKCTQATMVAPVRT